MNLLFLFAVFSSLLEVEVNFAAPSQIRSAPESQRPSWFTRGKRLPLARSSGLSTEWGHDPSHLRRLCVLPGSHFDARFACWNPAWELIIRIVSLRWSEHFQIACNQYWKLKDILHSLHVSSMGTNPDLNYHAHFFSILNFLYYFKKKNWPSHQCRVQRVQIKKLVSFFFCIWLIWACDLSCVLESMETTITWEWKTKQKISETVFSPRWELWRRVSPPVVSLSCIHFALSYAAVLVLALAPPPTLFALSYLLS